jgi:hypothetical protein
MEHEMYDYTGNNWSHRNSNKRFEETLGSRTSKTFNRITAKESYAWNITHNTGSTREKRPVTRDNMMMMMIVITTTTTTVVIVIIINNNNLIMETAGSSEMSVYFYKMTCHILEESNLCLVVTAPEHFESPVTDVTAVKGMYKGQVMEIASTVTVTVTVLDGC